MTELTDRHLVQREAQGRVFLETFRLLGHDLTSLALIQVRYNSRYFEQDITDTEYTDKLLLVISAQHTSYGGMRLHLGDDLFHGSIRLNDQRWVVLRDEV